MRETVEECGGHLGGGGAHVAVPMASAPPAERLALL